MPTHFFSARQVLYWLAILAPMASFHGDLTETPIEWLQTDPEDAKSQIILRRVDADAAMHVLRASRTRHLGDSMRDPLTGQIFMKNVEYSRNWVFTDLWTRDLISGSIQDIMSDTYILKARALTTRSWFWHSLHRQADQQNELGSKVHMGLFQALEMRLCDDAIVDTSPLLRLIPCVLFTTLSMDVYLIFAALPLFLSIFACDISCNSYRWFWAARHFSLPIRLLYIALAIGLWSQSTPSSDGSVDFFRAVGYILAVAMILYDIARGDLPQLLARREASHFEVIRSLRNEVFVVRWHGPPQRNPDYRLPEQLCGVCRADQRSDWAHVMLVAVIQGIICELRPFEERDSMWFRERTYYNTKATGSTVLTLNFCACDVFDKSSMDVWRVESDILDLKNNSMAQALAKTKDFSHSAATEELTVQDFD